jgi:hypothetical protein
MNNDSKSNKRDLRAGIAIIQTIVLVVVVLAVLQYFHQGATVQAWAINLWYGYIKPIGLFLWGIINIYVIKPLEALSQSHY